MKQTIRSIEDAANKYIANNDFNYLPIKRVISVSELKKEGLLDKEIVNSVNKENIDGCVVYNWNNEYNNYDISYSEDCLINQNNLIETLLVSSKSGLVKDPKDQNIYYFKGEEENVNNYLWYGGYSWRILEFNVVDKTLRLISQQPVVNLALALKSWTNENEYNNSHINKWLNGNSLDGSDSYFLNSFSPEIKNNIKLSNYNIGLYSNIKEHITTKKIGLLDENEYKRAGGNDSYLDIKNIFWLANRQDSELFRYVNYDGTIGSGLQGNTALNNGVRPVITISDIRVDKGNGTLKDNYRYVGNEVVEVGSYIRIPVKTNISGQDTCLFRVISKDSDSYKIILNGVLNEKVQYTSTNDSLGTISKENYIFNYINLFINNVIDNKYLVNTSKSYNIGKYELNPNNYGVNSKTMTTNFGLPVIGEMFTANDINISDYSLGIMKQFTDSSLVANQNLGKWFWLMNYGTNNSNPYLISQSGAMANVTNSTFEAGVRPTLFIKNNLKIIKGDGSPNNPFELE